jgi:hypothetical protein
MSIDDLFEKARQEAFAYRGAGKCKICQRDIPVEKRPGRPRLTCVTCDVYQAAVALIPPDPIPCHWCGVDFRPHRETARFCSDTCRQAAYREQRRSRTFTECQGCRRPLEGRSRKYCSAKCCQRFWNARRRKTPMSLVLTCPECHTPFQPGRAGVTYCSPICAKRRADRSYYARRATRRSTMDRVP